MQITRIDFALAKSRGLDEYSRVAILIKSFQVSYILRYHDFVKRTLFITVSLIPKLIKQLQRHHLWLPIESR